MRSTLLDHLVEWVHSEDQVDHRSPVDGKGSSFRSRLRKGCFPRKVAHEVQGRWSGQEGTDNTQREKGERLTCSYLFRGLEFGQR